MTTVRRAYYFGCQEDAGHKLYGPAQMPYRTAYPDRADFPKHWNIGYLDGGILSDAEVPDQITGNVYWVSAPKLLWLGFAWWDRSGDSRPNSSSGFYVSGFEVAERVKAFAFACAGFPHIVARQKHKLILQGA